MNTLGDCCEPLGLGTLDGDPDKRFWPVAGSLAPIPWLQSATHQVLAHWTELEGGPLSWSAREVLSQALQPLTDMGLRVVVATELEFYLLDEGDGPVPSPMVGRIPGTNLGQRGTQYCNPEDMAEFDAFLEAVRLACEVQNLPATTAHLEFAPGQFEINLHHVDDAVLACDHAVMLKRVIKAAARKHGFIACFMAKPFEEDAGNGLHIHMSLVDKNGQNYFSHGKEKMALPPFSARLRHAVGGRLKLMPESTALFCPNANSYRRLRPDMFAPVEPNWGVNHRVVSVRIPESDEAALRFEHRVAGADANPYLVMAAVAAAAHHGMKNKLDPGKMVEQGAEIVPKLKIPNRWDAALDRFARSKVLTEYLGEDFCRYYTLVRRVESEKFHNKISQLDFDWYLRAV